MQALGLLSVVAGAAYLVHRFAPEMGKACEHIFDRMPDQFPPKWMYLNITATREQNERMIQLLEERAKARG